MPQQPKRKKPMKQTVRTSTKKKRPAKLARFRSRNFIIFALVFGAIGSIYLWRTFAAQTSISYRGQLSNQAPAQEYTVTVGSGSLTARHDSKDSNLRLSILNGTGSLIAQKAGSNASITTTVTPGTYTVRVDYLGAIKGVKKYTLTISYPTADATAPSVVITSPTGDTVTGTIAVQASASDDVGVSKVDFLIDNQLAASDTSSPYGYSWNTAAVADGQHTITAKAYDAAGNAGTASRTVTVSNTTTTPPPPTSSSPSGQSMPVGDVTSGGHTWHQVFAEDFTKDAALGSWGSDCDGSKIVYTGATGTQWRAYPKCYVDTYQKRPYRSDAVLSVAGGMLDFWLHTVDGKPAGANPSPVLPGGTQYQTYGRYEARIKQTTPDLSEFYQAWLLWPSTGSDWQCAESDFPEGSLGSSTVNAFAHYGCSGTQDYFAKTLDKTQWHTYTQEWLPGKRNYYIDGVLIGSTTNQVYSKPERWQLQTETKTTCDSNNTCTQNGHLQVDWAVVYTY